ncbi:MAG: ATP-binding cassette domain-containing protein [Planctomycetes bacterium]|nr:ATP-binding cassette domain-containing protein [Planctomycetota bacterium]
MRIEPSSRPTPESANGATSSHNLRRMVGLVRPHRKMLAIGIGAAIIAAAFHAVSLSGMFPILQIMVADEGLHAWVDRNAASGRVGADLTLHTPDLDGSLDYQDIRPVVVRNLHEGSPLVELGIHNGDQIVSLEGERLDGKDWLQRVAAYAPGTTIRFQIDSVSETYELTLGELDWEWRIGRPLVSYIPRPGPGESQLGALFYVLLAVVAIALLASVFRFIAEYCTMVAVLRSVKDLRRQLYGKVLRLPMDFFARNVSDTVSRFIQDTQEVQRGLQTLFGRMTREPAKAFFLFSAAMYFNPRITITVALVSPWIILLFWAVGKKVRKANKRLLRGWGRMVGTLEASFRGIAVVKAYTAEDTERRRFGEIDQRMLDQQLRMAWLDAFIGPALQVLTVVAASAGLYWLASEVLAGRIERAAFATLSILLAAMFDPIRKAANVYNKLQRAMAGAERIYAVIDAPEEAERGDEAVKLPPLERQIEFRDVTFVYPGADRPALDRVDLTLKRGETVAIVGPNGSGKTTLINHLLRFYDPQQGEILFDDVNIAHGTLRSLRQQIALVTQDPVIFAISISDNVAYGSPDGTQEDVLHAARQAFADDFIRLFEDGYDTVPGDLGRTMSGGQRQRIAIARAVYRDTPILIFDEATSQVDSESEQKIQTALKALSKDRTTLIVAHRLSTIRFADRIVLMDMGRIADTGTHDELFHRSPLYRALCETQFFDMNETKSQPPTVK